MGWHCKNDRKVVPHCENARGTYTKTQTITVDLIEHSLNTCSMLHLLTPPDSEATPDLAQRIATWKERDAPVLSFNTLTPGRLRSARLGYEAGLVSSFISSALVATAWTWGDATPVGPALFWLWALCFLTFPAAAILGALIGRSGRAELALFVGPLAGTSYSLLFPLEVIIVSGAGGGLTAGIVFVWRWDILSRRRGLARPLVLGSTAMGFFDEVKSWFSSKTEELDADLARKERELAATPEEKMAALQEDTTADDLLANIQEKIDGVQAHAEADAELIEPEDDELAQQD